MNNYSNLTRRITLLFLGVVMFLCNPVSAAFIISGESSCFGNDIYSYHFTDSAFIPDYTIIVNETAFYPDITMELVTDPKQADLIFVDGLDKGDMKVCKDSVSFSAKTIVISDEAFFADITVRLSETGFLSDYKIFIQSENFTKEEVAALFAVIWQANRDK